MAIKTDTQKYNYGTYIVVVAITLVLYLAGAFTAASFDIFTWTTGGRLVLAVIWMFALTAWCGARYTDNNGQGKT